MRSENILGHRKVIAPKATAKFASIKNNNISIKQCVGIDTGETRAVRAGIRKNNDLIWVGKAPSLAAKLSDCREHPYCVYITKAVHSLLSDTQKEVGGINIWENRSLNFAGGSETVYRTKWMLQP
jgi:adenylate cyclase